MWPPDAAPARLPTLGLGSSTAAACAQGREATVVQPDVRDYKHHDGKQHELSANLPVKVGPRSVFFFHQLFH